MSPVTAPLPQDSAGPVIYPDNDGQPMADNTEQFAFIQLVQANLDAIRGDFVAGDHLWYPVRGRPDIRVAPDVYVAEGRAKGHRGSYRQWEEGGAPLTVVFEWWSPNSSFPKETEKLRFYERYGVSEFYSWDQVRQTFAAFLRVGDTLEPTDTSEGFTSPRLGIRMLAVAGELKLFRPDGSPFRTLSEMEAERDAATAERDAAIARAEALAAKLRALGLDSEEG